VQRKSNSKRRKETSALVRVTGWVDEKIAQNLAQHIFLSK
jgi:hypothetical protein